MISQVTSIMELSARSTYQHIQQGTYECPNVDDKNTNLLWEASVYTIHHVCLLTEVDKFSLHLRSLYMHQVQGAHSLLPMIWDTYLIFSLYMQVNLRRLIY
jgi:hypothetical protein